VHALQMYHGYLFAGSFSRHALITDTCFARWDGQNWALLLGINGNVTSLVTYKDELYIGGHFNRIGADSISNLARYYSADSLVQGIGGSKKNNNLNIYPNPAQGYINVIYNSTLTNDRLLIYTSQGALYATFALEKGQRFVKLNTETWVSGLYFVSQQNNEKGSSNFQKILIQH
jgi:hypothetical protein